MAAPNSKTSIANLALRHLGNTPVVSIDPPDSDSKAAMAAADWYDAARRACLEDHPWDFACKRKNIAAESAGPEFEYDYKYELPSDYVRMVRIGENWDYPITDYEIEGNYVLCNEGGPLKLVYISDFQNVVKFSPKFVIALSYKLAGHMAYQVTGNASLVSAMADQYAVALTSAASIDSQNRPPRRVQHSKLEAARKGFNRPAKWRGRWW